MEKLESTEQLPSLSIQRLKIKGFITTYIGFLVSMLSIVASAMVIERVNLAAVLALTLIIPIVPPVYSWLKPRPSEHCVASLNRDTLSLLGYDFKKENVEWMIYCAVESTKHILCIKLTGFEPLEVQLTRPDFINDMRLFKFITKHFHSIKLVDDLKYD